MIRRRGGGGMKRVGETSRYGRTHRWQPLRRAARGHRPRGAGATFPRGAPAKRGSRACRGAHPPARGTVKGGEEGVARRAARCPSPAPALTTVCGPTPPHPAAAAAPVAAPVARRRAATVLAAEYVSANFILRSRAAPRAQRLPSVTVRQLSLPRLPAARRPSLPAPTHHYYPLPHQQLAYSPASVPTDDPTATWSPPRLGHRTVTTALSSTATHVCATPGAHST